MKKTIEVCAGIIEKDNKILCTQRGKSKNDEVSFKYEFPGGKLEVGETPFDAIKRELKEELDMDVLPKEIFCKIEHSYTEIDLKMYCIKCELLDNNFVLKEHLAYKWLSKNELDSLDWAPADLKVVAKIKETM